MTIDKEQGQLQALKERFSYMFTGSHLGQDLYRGWLQDFTDACEQIDRLLGDDKRGFRFTQIKELMLRSRPLIGSSNEKS